MKFDIKNITALLIIAGISIVSAAALTAPAQPQTRIDIDQKTGAIRFIVNGHEEARIDPAGLRVRKDIRYFGTEGDGMGGDYDR